MSSMIKKEKRAVLVKYPGSPLSHFKLLFKRAEEALKLLNYPDAPSPYSVVPLITQAMGLEVPMMGTGKSAYSIISHSLNLKKSIFLEKGTQLSLRERREIIDEIYEMIPPYLLQEQKEYIELLVATRYKKSMQNYSPAESAEFKSILFKKFTILRSFLSKIKFTGGNFSHIAHYGYAEDLYREQSFLRDFDKETAKLWRDNSYPIVTEIQLDGYNAPNKCITGWFIFVSNYTEELLLSKTLRQKKLLQAGMLARSLNAKFSGMAGLIASFSKGGRYLSDNISDFGFTTGHSYTIGNIYEIIKDISKRVSLDLSKSKVAIVGAAGSIGSGVSKIISENPIKEIMLVDMPNMVSSNKLVKLKEALKQINPGNLIKISKTIDDIKESDLIIVATNSPTSIIEPRHLKPGAIIIDDSFPKNVSRETLKERQDIILLEGGVTQMPRLNIDVSRHLPDLLDLSISKLVSCSQAYGCLAETFILAALGHKGNYGLGDADPELARNIMEKGRNTGFNSAIFQNYGFAVEESRIKQVKGIVKKRAK